MRITAYEYERLVEVVDDVKTDPEPRDTDIYVERIINALGLTTALDYKDVGRA